MTILLAIPSVISLLLLAAHFLRAASLLLTLFPLLLIPLAFLSRPWLLRTLQVILLLAALEWLRTALLIAQARAAAEQPYLRALAILLCVALFNLLSAALLQLRLRKTPALATL